MATPRREAIEALRTEKLMLSRSQFAAKVGISYKHVYGIERGKHPVDVVTLYKIAAVFDVPIDDVMVRAGRGARDVI